jgi:hypothetical protein
MRGCHESTQPFRLSGLIHEIFVIKGYRSSFASQQSNLEQLYQCSVRDPAHFNWMNKSQNMLVWLSKMVLHRFAEAGKTHTKA